MIKDEVMIYKYLKDRISLINEHIKLVTESFMPEIRPMVEYSLTYGQRLRPVLFIVSYEISGKSIKENKDILSPGIALEFLHKASLSHDDIVDRDSYRRGKKSIPGRFGKSKALILGDLLIAGAYSLINSLPSYISPEKSHRLRELFNEIFFRLSQGELMDIIYEERKEISEEEIIKLMEDKTAVFIQNAMIMGAVLRGADREEEEKLRRYGLKLGLAFQLINDLNNCNGLERNLKKNFASDLVRKKKNILLVMALQDKKSEIYTEVIKLLRNPPGEKEAELLAGLIFSNGITGKLKNKVERLLSQCREIALSLPAGLPSSILQYIPQHAFKETFWQMPSFYLS